MDSMSMKIKCYIIRLRLQYNFKRIRRVCRVLRKESLGLSHRESQQHTRRT